MTPMTGFAPDANRNMPGALIDCAHFIPYESGMRGAPTGVAVNVSALATPCIGAAIVALLDGTRRVFAGTATKLWELVSGVWTDRSSAVYTSGADTRWSFTQFGNTSIASNLADNMQSSASGNFADIAGAPKAKIVVSATNNFVLAFNTVDGTFGVSPDRWWCCAQSNQADWVPSVSTLCTTGRLIAVEGPIEAALPLGDYVVAYKKRGIFLGTFAGPPVVWQWPLVASNDVGCVGQEAVCDIGGAHFFVSDDNFWLFDGTRPIPIGDGKLRNWFFADANASFLYRTKCIFDRQNSIVRVHYVSKASTGACDSTVVYHILRKEWGRDNFTIQAPLNYVGSGVTIDGLTAYSATIDGLPAIPFDSPFWSAGGKVSAYFDGSNQLRSLDGATADSSFSTSDMGNDDLVTTIDRFRVRFESSPATAIATGWYKMNEGDALLPGPSNSINDGKFDIRQSGRFHRVSVAMTGDVRAYAYDVKPRPVGGR